MASQLSICPIERFSNLCRVVALQIRNTHNLMDGAKRIFLASCPGIPHDISINLRQFYYFIMFVAY